MASANKRVAEYARHLREAKRAEEQKKNVQAKKSTSNASRAFGGASTGNSSISTARSGPQRNGTASLGKGPVRTSAGSAQDDGRNGGLASRPQRELTIRRTQAEVVAFTLDHFVAGVVNWNIFGELHAEGSGNRAKWEDQSDMPNVTVPNSFRSAIEYAQVWTPLLVREVRAQILSELCGSDSWQKQTVHSTRVVDTPSPISSRPELNLSDVHPEFDEPKVGQKVQGRGRGGNSSPQNYPEHEMVLFMSKPDAIADAIKGRGDEPPSGFLGVVSTATRTREGLSLRVSTNMLKAHRPADRNMFCMTLGSLRPTLREFDSITGLGRIPLQASLLTGRAHESGSEQVQSLGNKFVSWLEARFNPSQQEAIRAGANSRGFTLIKGPPGTGKTTTLKALLNALHQREYNRYYEKLLNLARVAPENTPSAWDKLKQFAPHILITAPSNVAVDNIVSRILEEGFLDGNADRYNPSMVRVGSGSVDNKVKPVALQSQVSASLNLSRQELTARMEHVGVRLVELRDGINRSLELLRVLINACTHEFPHGWEARVDRQTFRAYFVDHTHQRTTLEPPDPPTPHPGVPAIPVESMPEYVTYAEHMTRDLETYERLSKEHRRITFALRAKTEHREHAVRQSLEVTLLDEAHLVFSTLNSSGLPCMDHTASFEVIVVDEAAQSVEVSTIIPLRLGCKHCVLVGDPNQLPATVFSQGGKLSQYDRSLFQRLEACGHPVHMLDTQYRMHPIISAFPRSAFYQDKLKDGPNVILPDYTRSFHQHPLFRPFMFLDLVTGEQSRRTGGSLSNPREAQLALNVYLTLKRRFSGIGAAGSGDEFGIAGRVGVISPYAQQVKELRHEFQEALGSAWQEEVEISTVDAFQGREKDVIIVSTVRAAGSRGIGFLADVRRMNVALTRARHGLFVIGSEAALSVNPKWAELTTLAKSRRGLVRIKDAQEDLMAVRPVDEAVAESSTLPRSPQKTSGSTIDEGEVDPQEPRAKKAKPRPPSKPRGPPGAKAELSCASKSPRKVVPKPPPPRPTVVVREGTSSSSSATAPLDPRISLRRKSGRPDIEKSDGTLGRPTPLARGEAEKQEEITLSREQLNRNRKRPRQAVISPTPTENDDKGAHGFVESGEHVKGDRPSVVACVAGIEPTLSNVLDFPSVGAMDRSGAKGTESVVSARATDCAVSDSRVELSPSSEDSAEEGEINP